MKKFKNAFGWDIEQTPIYDQNGNVISGYKKIERDDNSKLIAVKKETFHPMTTQEFTNVTETIAHNTGMEIAGYEDWQTNKDDGRNMGARKQIVTAQLESKNKLHIGGSVIEGFLTIGVGFDGSRSFYIGHTNNYLRCTNEFSRIIKDFTSRLTKNNMVRVEEIIQSIGLYEAYEKDLYETFKHFQNVKIDDKIIAECVSRLAGLTDEERLDKELISTRKYNKMCDIKASILGECAELGHDAWGLLNGVTHYSTHVATSRTADHFGNMFGSKAELNQKGFDLCLELATA